jgi:hypothetical protein
MGMLSDVFGGSSMPSGFAEATAVAREGLDFNKEIYADAQNRYNLWEQTFGPIQNNLADYYNTLDPAKYEARMKGSVGDAYDVASKRLTENLASRGIQGSGIEAAALGQLEEGRAQGIIQAELQAPEMVNQMKQGFLTGAGMPQQGMHLSSMTGAQQGVNQASGALQQSFMQQGNWEMMNQQNINSAMGSIAGFAGQAGMIGAMGGFTGAGAMGPR